MTCTRRRRSFSSRTGRTGIVLDETLSLLVSRPNVIITSHQGFFTEEALQAIAETTVSNILAFFDGRIVNEVIPPEASPTEFTVSGV